MAAELIAVVGATLKFKDPTHSGTITVAGAVGVPPSVLSQSVKSDGNAAYFGLSFNITGFVGSGIDQGVGAGTIVGTSGKAKGNANSFVIESDEVTITVAGKSTASPFPPASVPTTVVIDSVGQSVVRVQ